MRSPMLVIALALLAGACHHGEEAEHLAPAPLPPPVRDGDAVFFVGNSFLGWQDRPLPAWVAALGQAMHPPVRIQVGADIVVGNTPLSGFLGHPAVQAALASHRYRAFVLQGEEFEPVDHKAAFHQAVRDFHRAVTAAGGQVVLLMTWDFSWRPFIDELQSSYDEIGRELGVLVVPVGRIYKDCDQRPYRGAAPFWLTARPDHPVGNLHQNEMGTAVNAYAVFQALTGLDTHGATFAAPGNTSDADLLRYLSDMAWARVRPRLRLAP